MITKHFINGTEIRPQNAVSIGFKADWNGNPKEAEITVDKLVLVTNAYSLVMEHIFNGAGLFEGIPYRIEVDGFGIDYFIDLTDSPIFADNFMEVSIKKRKAVDKFKQDADGLSFELLNKKVNLSYIQAPYIIVKDNQLEVGMMLGITIYSLTTELITQIDRLNDLVTAGIQASTPNVGVPPSIDTGDVIAYVLKVIAQIVYTIALIIALIDLVTQLMELIFPPVRYLKANTIKYLIEAGCNYLGYSLSSTKLDQYDKAALIPVPLQKTNKSIFNFNINFNTQSYTKGYPTASDSTPTLGSLIDAVNVWLNTDFRIIGSTVYIENQNYWYSQNGVNIQNTMNIQDTRQNSYTYNFGDMWKRCYLHYLTDIADSHTYDNFTSTDCEYSTEPLTIVNADLVTIKGLNDINIPFALGDRKSQLNFIEKVALNMAEIADNLINFFGGNSNLAGKVEGRIGLLQISQQFYSVTKVIWAINGKQPSNYLDIIGANAIYQKEHVSNQVKENFQKVFTSSIPFSQSQFLQLLENNVVNDQFGNELKILTFDWINETSVANIQYTEKSTDANNIQTILIDG